MVRHCRRLLEPFTGQWQHKIEQTSFLRFQKFHSQTTPTDKRKIYIGALHAAAYPSGMRVEIMKTDTKVMDQMEKMAQAQVIKDARYLANEHLVRSEQLGVCFHDHLTGHTRGLDI